MRWVCHHYPALPLEVLSPPVDQPCAVVEARGNRRLLTYLNPSAYAQGLSLGMAQQAALGRVPQLQVLTRQASAETEALEALACRAYGFGTPVVVDPTTFSVWVEVERSLSLFGGWKRLAEAIQESDERRPYTVRLGSAPTLAAAQLLARASEKPRRPVARLADLPRALSPLPLSLLPFATDRIEVLIGAGLRRIGDVLAIPRAALGKRIGADHLLALQRLLGEVPEVWDAWQPPTIYRRRWEFAEGIESTEALLFPLRIVMAEFVAYLKARDLSVQHFRLRLIDTRKRVVIHPIGLLSPTRDVARMLLVLRERLDHLALEDAVMEVSVEADRFEPASAIQDDLFADISAQAGARFIELRERLIARLGEGVVRQLAVSADQRPERSAEPLAASNPRAANSHPARGTSHPDRPLWLLPKPERIQPRQLLSVPERIELGWWEDRGEPISRDYVVAEDQFGRVCWAYREAGSSDWHLHGLWQ